MKAEIYTTSEASGKKLSLDGSVEFILKNTDVIEETDKSGDIESCIINLHPDLCGHTFMGFGGAFTESAASAWSKMNAEKKQELIDAYFNPNSGIGYTFGRVHINSCDFSEDDYTYVSEGDKTLDSFDISREKKAVIPMIKEAMKNTELTLFASPWSPPAYMKTSKSVQGGHLDKKYYGLWAKYFRRFIEEYKKEGICISAVTIQNEPRHHQIWESCLYTPEEESEFLGFLGKELEGTGTKILCYDHCRERMYERAKAIFESRNGKYCSGIACHWYSGDHFGEIAAVKEKYPHKLQVMSEGCCFDPICGIKTENAWKFGEQYAHDISGAITAGLNYYCDWNLCLNEKNGPFHHREGRNFVDVPIYCDSSSGKLVYQPSYYYIGHYSKFIRPGAKCISFSCYTAELDVCAFKNPDNSLICVILNTKDGSKDTVIRIENNILKLSVDAHSIKTLKITE